jgi:hypothetical protein
VVALMAAAALTLAGPAAAEDAFYFENEAGIGFTGTMPAPEPECFFGQTGLFVTSPNPSLTGSLRSEMGFLSECPSEFWDPLLAYNAVLGHADRSAGSGDATTQLILRR